MTDIAPILTPKPTANGTFKGFIETARWSVSVDGEAIGDVWRGNDNRGRTCWMMDVPTLRSSHPAGAAIGGYSATTKKGVVEDLVRWHENHIHSFDLDGVYYHCAVRRDRGYELDLNYLAEFPDGLRRWVNVTNVIDPKPHMGAMAMAGWYASSHRGNRFIQALYAATEQEALLLIQAEVGLPMSAEDRRQFHVPAIKITGSLVREIESDVTVLPSP